MRLFKVYARLSDLKWSVVIVEPGLETGSGWVMGPTRTKKEARTAGIKARTLANIRSAY